MISAKKFLKIFLIAIVVIMASLFIFGYFYYTNLRVIENNWEIDLPEGLEEEYYQHSEIGFQGDGKYYHVFSSKGSESIDEFVRDFETEKNPDMENTVTAILDELAVPKNKRINFHEDYLWMVKFDSVDPRDTLYLIYQPQASKWYVIRDIY